MSRGACGDPPRPGALDEPLDVLLALQPQPLGRLRPPTAEALPAPGCEVLAERVPDELAATARVLRGCPLRVPQKVDRERDGDGSSRAHAEGSLGVTR